MTLCKDKPFTTCTYMPNIDNIKPDEIVLDEDGVKHRKEPKVAKCLYDLHIFKPMVECPRPDGQDEKIEANKRSIYKQEEIEGDNFENEK